MRIPEWTFADRLRKARQEVHLNQRDFAERLQVTAAAYAQWEAGNARPRDVVTIAKRVELLAQVPASWLLDLAPTPVPAAAAVGDEWAPRGSNPEPAGYAGGLDGKVLHFRRHRKPWGYVSDQVSATTAG